jgi:hypothetical protein
MLVEPVMYELDEELDGGDVEAGYLGSECPQTGLNSRLKTLNWSSNFICANIRL